ncbi:Hypothetical predicted protein [Octopus vulgaris]|uniref:Uncharacterized protein n=1 Tax=Octopus vulgaris TaxID=6645 RepID=A0AA36B1H0_OCTVU|nr:Hypothetical predicted protein [Octopus vulgaris]
MHPFETNSETLESPLRKRHSARIKEISKQHNKNPTRRNLNGKPKALKERIISDATAKIHSKPNRQYQKRNRQQTVFLDVANTVLFPSYLRIHVKY